MRSHLPCAGRVAGTQGHGEPRSCCPHHQPRPPQGFRSSASSAAMVPGPLGRCLVGHRPRGLIETSRLSSVTASQDRNQVEPYATASIGRFLTYKHGITQLPRTVLVLLHSNQITKFPCLKVARCLLPPSAQNKIRLLTLASARSFRTRPACPSPLPAP